MTAYTDQIDDACRLQMEQWVEPTHVDPLGLLRMHINVEHSLLFANAYLAAHGRLLPLGERHGAE